jgi:hypothetical protein
MGTEGAGARTAKRHFSHRAALILAACGGIMARAPKRQRSAPLLGQEIIAARSVIMNRLKNGTVVDGVRIEPRDFAFHCCAGDRSVIPTDRRRPRGGNAPGGQLDFDRDGKMSRAAITQYAVTGQADLCIYLAPGAAKLDPSLAPSFLRKNLTRQRILGIDGASAGSFIIKFDCGGCSNDSETTLSIVHHGGDFLVAGLIRAWDTRDGQGSCDIDFLTGRSIASTGLDDESRSKKDSGPCK